MKHIQAHLMGAMLLLLSLCSRAGTVVNLGSITQINDPSGLDLAGEMAYAINFSANDPVLYVNGVTFTPDRLIAPPVTVGPNNVAPWGTTPNFGSGIDADNLENLYQDIRWANPSQGQALEAHLPVTANETYKLQLLIYGNGAENRRWDIEVEGAIVVDEFTSRGASDAAGVLPVYSTTAGVVYSYTLVAPDSTLDVRMGNIGGINDGGDRNPIWQALTLEHVVPDTDGDDLPDSWEITKFSDITSQTGTSDADGDGLSNQFEYQLGTNPNGDTDSDGLSDGAEYFTYRSNLFVADTDGDGLNDGAEVTAGSSIVLADTDGDGLTDGAEVNTHSTSPIDRDTDDDDYPDGVEIANSTNASNPASFPLLSSFGTSIYGADATEGLDLSGDFKYAFNVGGGAPGPIRGVDFTDESNGGLGGITVTGAGLITAWGSQPNLGASADDDALEMLLWSIRHAGSNGGSITVTLTGLTPGKPYKLQMLFFERCCTRACDIYVDGTLKLDEFAPYTYQDGTGAPTRAAAAVIGFLATGPSVQIVLNGATVTTPAYTDRNPILNGVILEEVTGADADGDGLTDVWETANFGNLSQTGAGDFDSDGLTNLEEMNFATDPKDADMDDDGLNDGPEVHTHLTDPKKADTDSDGLSDGYEVSTSHTDPLVADSDEDGYTDKAEEDLGTDPLNPASYPLISALTSSFTGGDAGEGLDLQGTFPYAFNVGTPGAAPGPVRDVNFTDDAQAGITLFTPNEIPNWTPAEYGSTPNDNNLEFVMQSMRWAAAPDTARIDLAGLTVGRVYKLQMLFAEGCCAGRGFDIEVEGVLRVDEFNPSITQGGVNNAARGAVVTLGFVATDNTLNIVLNGNGITTATFNDHNPTIHAVTLEDLTGTLADTDADNLPDAWEMQFFGNLVQTGTGDPDNDGKTNAGEFLANTLPLDPDTDNDGLTDGAEGGAGTNPLASDTDFDGLTDAEEVGTTNTNPLLADTDGDGYSDVAEVIAGSNAQSNTSIPTVTTGVFTGGDAGEGLDLDGTFVYAFNFGTPGAAGQARDANFTADSAPGITFSTVNEIPNWHGPIYGDTANDDVLEFAMQSIRWTPAPGSVSVNLANLEAGKRYKLQLLFAETGTARGFDVLLEGGKILDDFYPGLLQGNSNTQGAFLAFEFTAHDTVLNIVLNGVTTTAPDKNPILSAATLESLPPPPPLDITGVSLAPSGLTINTSGVPFRTYSVDYSTDLQVWDEVWDSLVPNSAGTASWQDTDPLRVGAGVRRGFYRLRDPVVDPSP